MSNAMKAADELKLLANRLRPLFEVAKSLEEIGSLEQAARDAEIRKDAAYKAADEAKAQLEMKMVKIAEANEEVLQAKECALEIEDSAKMKANAVLSMAQDKAAEVIKAADAKKAAINKEVGAAQLSLAQLKSDIDSKKKELQSVLEEIKSVKAKISAFVGA